MSTLGRFGQTMLEAEHALLPADTLPTPLPPTLPPGPRVGLSNVLVALGAGPDDLRISTPANARLEAIPALPTRPESYRLVREAEVRGVFFDPPPGIRPLWTPSHATTIPINRDRDLNGVGLLYFANYVAFMDVAERAALEGRGGFAAGALDGRATVRRRVGFYGNARPSDTLVVEVDAFALDATRLLVDHRVRRQSDGRLIAIASAEATGRRVTSAAIDQREQIADALAAADPQLRTVEGHAELLLHEGRSRVIPIESSSPSLSRGVSGVTGTLTRGEVAPDEIEEQRHARVVHDARHLARGSGRVDVCAPGAGRIRLARRAAHAGARGSARRHCPGRTAGGVTWPRAPT